MSATHCAACGNPDCVTVSPAPFWSNCPAAPTFGLSEDDLCRADSEAADMAAGDASDDLYLKEEI